MKWIKLSDTAITNGDQFIANEGLDDEYKHGTHIISKAKVGDIYRYTLWEGKKAMGFFNDAKEAMRYAEQ